MTEHTVEVVTAPASQKITCPGCGYVFRELITENVGASQCPGCGDQINYDRNDEDSSTADDTEQSELLPDGGSYYSDAGDGQCLAIKDSDGERCTNGVYGSNLCCGTHKNADDVTLAPEQDDREWRRCSGCGWQPCEWEQGGGDPPFCSWCSCRFPADAERWQDRQQDVDEGPALVDELYALREGDRVDVELVGKGEPMAIVDEVQTDTDGQTETAERTIEMETLAKRTISVTIGYDANTDESELTGATIDGPEMADARPIEIAGVDETAQQTLEEAMAQPAEASEWPPETTVLYCRRCGEEHEHDRTTSEKTGERAWKCPEYNILNDPLQPRLGAFTGGERA